VLPTGKPFPSSSSAAGRALLSLTEIVGCWTSALAELGCLRAGYRGGRGSDSCG
jgi:hypothetical protein